VVPLAFALAALVQSDTGLPVYWTAHPNLSLGGSQGFSVAIAERAGTAWEESRTSTSGEPVQVVLQRLKLLSSSEETAATLTFVTPKFHGRNFYYESELPEGKRFIVAYFRPSSGKNWLNNNKEVELSMDEASGQFALGTSLTKLVKGLTLQETYFLTYLENMSKCDVELMVRFAEQAPRPPKGWVRRIPNRAGEWVAEPLQAYSESTRLKGGLFDVMFHVMLGRWSIGGSGEWLLDALLEHKSDARLETILSWRRPEVREDHSNRKYDKPENQELLLAAAQSTFSETAAVLFSARLIHPMRDFREQFLGLLRREMPILRANICNMLAIDYKKPERMLPFAKDQEGWEQRVAEMSQIWLNELGG
jgi:hypothetical protein